ncbi:MAG: DUF882 domain-containing protein [Winogradskyella sp.]|uniref:D-Ala-D-Ala carboxypeptidase family metallohydrolase n=1 Tax=Winogradskyella sp. TaxID=1883156 RepID=UPI00184AAAD6|nr:DUF882 domain-containing protein [Winogradskyella sp.]
MTKNFKLKEFECKCGCDMPLEVYENIIKLASQLQFLRDYTGRPITINSAYRCPEHNEKVGGSKTSQHLLGKAADITIQSLKPAEVFVLIEDLIDMGHMLQGGLGLYDTFVHYDIRKTKARWNG